MLNYIWAFLIIAGLSVAIYTDISNEINDTYQNGNPYKCEIVTDHSGKSILNITENSPIFHNSKYEIQLKRIKENEFFVNLFLGESESEELQTMAASSGEKNDLSGNLIIHTNQQDSKIGEVIFESVRLVKMKQVTDSLINYAGIAVKIAIGLIGVMALWLGIMKIAEEAGIVKIISKIVRPVTKFLFPQVPHDHPAIGAIVMNMSANMLGLGNAATPFGLKAMEELNKLNKVKDTATNAMCTFLAVNTAGLTLIPATAIAVRASTGSSNPTIIIATSIFGAFCATTVGILSAKFFEKFTGQKSFIDILKSNWKKYLILFVSLIILFFMIDLLFDKITSLFGSLFGGENLKNIITTVSSLAIPAIIALFVFLGLIKKIKIYEVFVEGAKEGFNVAVRIIPFLVAMLIAIAIFRAGGGMELLIQMLTPFTDLIGMPSEALPMALMRPLSGSGSLGIMTETINQFGPDSFIGVLTSTFFGSTETTFYVLAVYFGSVNIKKTRHALPVGLLADIAGILGALFIVKQLFG